MGCIVAFGWIGVPHGYCPIDRERAATRVLNAVGKLLDSAAITEWWLEERTLLSAIRHNTLLDTAQIDAPPAHSLSNDIVIGVLDDYCRRIATLANHFNADTSSAAVLDESLAEFEFDPSFDRSLDVEQYVPRTANARRKRDIRQSRHSSSSASPPAPPSSTKGASPTVLSAAGISPPEVIPSPVCLRLWSRHYRIGVAVYWYRAVAPLEVTADFSARDEADAESSIAIEGGEGEAADSDDGAGGSEKTLVRSRLGSRRNRNPPSIASSSVRTTTTEVLMCNRFKFGDSKHFRRSESDTPQRRVPCRVQSDVLPLRYIPVIGEPHSNDITSFPTGSAHLKTVGAEDDYGRSRTLTLPSQYRVPHYSTAVLTQLYGYNFLNTTTTLLPHHRRWLPTLTFGVDNRKLICPIASYGGGRYVFLLLCMASLFVLCLVFMRLLADYRIAKSAGFDALSSSSTTTATADAALNDPRRGGGRCMRCRNCVNRLITVIMIPLRIVRWTVYQLWSDDGCVGRLFAVCLYALDCANRTGNVALDALRCPQRFAHAFVACIGRYRTALVTSKPFQCLMSLRSRVTFASSKPLSDAPSSPAAPATTDTRIELSTVVSTPKSL